MYQFDQISEQVNKKKKIFTALAVGVLVLAIPFAVTLIQQQQALRSKASTGNEIEFVRDTNVNCNSAGSCTSTSKTIKVNLRSPLGPQMGDVTPTPTPSSTTASSWMLKQLFFNSDGHTVKSRLCPIAPDRGPLYGKCRWGTEDTSSYPGLNNTTAISDKRWRAGGSYVHTDASGKSYLNQLFISFDKAHGRGRKYCEIKPSGPDWSTCTWSEFAFADDTGANGLKEDGGSWQSATSFTYTLNGVTRFNQSFINGTGTASKGRDCVVGANGVDLSNCSTRADENEVQRSWWDFVFNQEPRLAGSWQSAASFTYQAAGATYLSQSFFNADGNQSKTRVCNMPNGGYPDWSNCNWTEFAWSQDSNLAGTTWTSADSFVYYGTNELGY